MSQGVVTGEDGVDRCPWAGAPGLLRDYHDTEWGVRVHGETAYFERLSLEAFQSGLSWATILRKRPAFRAAFAGFDADRVAAFAEADVVRLTSDAGIVRNRRKIDATITNARATCALREPRHAPDDLVGLEALVLSLAPATDPAPRTVAEVATTSPGSVELSRTLKQHGFAFVGPITMHALMEALGLFDPHLLGCHRRGRGRDSHGAGAGADPGARP